MKRITTNLCRQSLCTVLFALLALALLGANASFAQYFNSGGPASGFDGYVTTAGCYAPLSGTAMRAVTDLTVLSPVGKIPLKFTRIYNSAYATLGLATSMGTWGTNWDYFLTQFSPTEFSLQLPQGGRFPVTVSAQNTWQTIPASGGIQFYLTGPAVNVILPDGTWVQFEGGGKAPVYAWTVRNLIDPYGQNYAVQVSTSTTGSSYPQTITTTVKVSDPTLTRWLQFVSQITLSSAKSVPSGGIQSVTTSDGQNVSYTYATDPSGKVSVLHTVNYSDQSQAVESYQDDANGTALLFISNEPRYAGPVKNITYGFLSPSKWYYSGMVSYEGVPNVVVLSSRSIPGNSTASAPIVVETRPDGSKRTFNGNSSGLVTQVTDFFGINTSYTYNGNSQLSTAIDGNGIQTVYQRESVIGAITEIDRNNRMTVKYTYTNSQFPYYVQTRTDANGNVTTYTRDNYNRVQTIAYPNNTVESFTYNNWGEVTSHTLSNSGVWQYSPDPATGNVTSATDPMGRSWTYTYDSRNRLASVTEVARNITAHYSYNNFNEVNYVKNTDGTTTNTQYDAFGGPLKYTDENGQQWQWTYDEYERLATAIDPLGNTTTYTYGALGQPESAFTNKAPVSVVTPTGKQTTFVYDKDFRLSQQTIGTDNSITTYTYDGDNNVLTVQDALGNVTTKQYDQWNRLQYLTDAANHTTAYGYDNVGNLTSVTRPDQVVITNVYNPMNRLKNTYRSYNSASSPQETWKYDPAGNVNYFQDYNGNVYQWQYNLDEQKTLATYPDNSSQTWSYDPAGNLSTCTNTSGQSEQFTFDYRNRMTSRAWNTGDQFADTISYQYDPAGHLAQVANSYSTVTNQYDPDGNLQYQTQAIAGGPSVTVNYGRNNDEFVDSVGTGSPYQYAVQYQYGPRDQLKAILDGSGNSIASFTYDLAGNRLNRSTAGASTSYTFDECNRLSTQTEVFAETTGRGPSGPPYNTNFIYPECGFAEYTYDTVSRVREITYTASTAPPPNNAYSYNRSYGYDTFDNLNNIGIGDELPLFPSLYLSYDPAGNRISSQLNNNPTVDYTTNNVNQYTAVGTLDPTYDQEHNLTSYNGSAFAYDWDHHLFSATNGTSDVESRYDGLGRCVSRTVNGTVTYVFYDGWNPILETNSAGAQTAARIYGPGSDEIIEAFGPSGNPGLFYHQNNVGSVTGLTDSLGNVVELYGYDEFGHTQIYNASGTQIPTSAYGNRFLFQGREYLAAVNVYDFRARAYNPDLGRFLQMDPIGFGGGNHLYRFAGNNPVSGRDPSGQAPMANQFDNPGAAWGGGTISADLAVGAGTSSEIAQVDPFAVLDAILGDLAGGDNSDSSDGSGGLQLYYMDASPNNSSFTREERANQITVIGRDIQNGWNSNPIISLLNSIDNAFWPWFLGGMNDTMASLDQATYPYFGAVGFSGFLNSIGLEPGLRLPEVEAPSVVVSEHAIRHLDASVQAPVSLAAMKVALDAYPFVGPFQQPITVEGTIYSVRAFVQPEALDTIYISTIVEGIMPRNIAEPNE